MMNRRSTRYRCGGHFACAAAVLVLVLGCRGSPAESTKDSKKLRVISLTPSATQVVATLGALDLLVGVDKYSVEPEAVQHLPKVGDFLSPNLEAMVALA